MAPPKRGLHCLALETWNRVKSDFNHMGANRERERAAAVGVIGLAYSIANMRPLYPATPMLDSLLGRAVYPGRVSCPNTNARISQMLPQPIETFTLIERKVDVASMVLTLGQGLRAWREECNRLLDVGGYCVGMRLNPRNSPIVIRMEKIEPKIIHLSA